LALCLAHPTGLQIARWLASLGQVSGDAPLPLFVPRDTAIEFFGWSCGPACVR